MGFIHAVHDLSKGEEFQKKSHPYIQKIWDDNTRMLQIFIEVKTLQLPMDPIGISAIRLTNGDIQLDVEKSKERYQFKRKPGSGQWQYGPLVQTGMVTAGQLNQTLTNIIFPKLKKRIFGHMEKKGLFVAGGASKIEKLVFSKLSTIESNIDVKYKTTLVFGISCNGKEYLPGDLACFDDYFYGLISDDFSTLKTPISCSLCGQKTTTIVNLNKVFNFSTFDKPGFIPGVDDKQLSKVFPVCETCYSELSHGRTQVEEKFNNTYTLPNTQIWIIPEVISSDIASSGVLKKQSVIKNFENYLQNDSSLREKRVLSALARQGSALNFHFLFVEKDKSKEALLGMIEDVSPSHLKKLEQIWGENVKRFTMQGNPKLDMCFSFITYTLMKDGKSKTNKMEAAYRKQMAIVILSKLLRKQPINIWSIKREFVSRYPQILHLDEYAQIIRNQFRVVEFIQHYNEEAAK